MGLSLQDSSGQVCQTRSVILKNYPRDPSMQIIPTLGPNVCKYYLHAAIWIPRVRSRFLLGPIGPKQGLKGWFTLLVCEFAPQTL